MKIAVAYKDGEIYEHFGHCECFAIYDYDFDLPEDQILDNVTKVLVDCSDRHGHKEMADLMKEQDVAAVIVGNMGPEAKAMLLSYGIVSVAGYCGPADLASDMLVTGQLPIDPEAAGGCGGGCGGCSGGCGGGCGGDDSSEGCGCGCGC